MLRPKGRLVVEIRAPYVGETPLSFSEKTVAIVKGIKPMPFAGVDMAVQGRKYSHGSKRVIALKSGRFVRVGVLTEGQPWFTSFFLANARELSPLPMRYHGGQLP